MAKYRVWVARDKNTQYSFLNVYDSEPDWSDMFEWYASSANGKSLFDIQKEEDVHIFMRAFDLQLDPGECKKIEIEV